MSAPTARPKWSERKSTTFNYRDVLQLAAHFVAYLFLRKLLFSAGNLDETAYRSPVLLVRLVERILSNAAYWTLAVLVLLLRERLLSRWGTTRFDVQMRWFCTVLACLLAAELSGQEFNLYFAQEYAVDRLVLLLLAILIALRPIFILPFVTLSIAIGGQFSFPLYGYRWDGPFLGVYRLPIHLLLAVFTGLAFQQHKLKQRADCTVLLVLVIVASGYWVPGIGKLQLGWHETANVHYSLFGGWCHGWLSFMDAEQVASITRRLAPAAISMQFVTLLFECAAIFILIRRVSLILLPTWIVFHLGALALYGYAFWFWIVIDACIFLFVLFQPEVVRTFKWQYCLIGMLLIGTSERWLNPNRLAWFNTRLCNTFEVVAVGNSGTRYRLTPDFFAPYDDILTLNMVSFVSRRNLLTGPYATASTKREALMTGPQLAHDQTKLSDKTPDPVRCAELNRFLLEFVHNWHKRRSSSSPFQMLQPPDLLMTTWDQVDIPSADQIAAIEVVRIQHILLEGTIRSEKVEDCMRIDVPGLP